MSIGTSEPVDCADPMAAAVDRISAASGVLFVVAAGNLGGRRGDRQPGVRRVRVRQTLTRFYGIR
ncbi:MAG TPA: hypothetical protein VFI00_14615 [Kribbella sp.]|nr:hypothetical protein [Kribbella sp.]